MDDVTYSRRDLPLNALRAFEAVAKRRSFSDAARDLGVAQSAVSRHIARLESIVGRDLFVREGRGIRLTESADALFVSVLRSFDGMARGLERVSSGAALRLVVPPGFIQGVGTPVLQQFKTKRPDVALSVSSITAVGAPEADYDIAVTFDRSDLHSDDRSLLWDVDLVPVCAAADARRIRDLGLKDALAREDLLHVSLQGYPPDHLWRRFASAMGLDRIRPSSLSFETYALAEEFAKSGAGMALADVRSFNADPEPSRLSAPFDVSAPSGFAYFLKLAPVAEGKAGAVDLRNHLLASARCDAGSAGRSAT